MKRDFMLVAGTAAIASLLTWFAADLLTTRPDAARGEVAVVAAEPADPPVPSGRVDPVAPASPARPAAGPAVEQQAARAAEAAQAGGAAPRDPTLAFKKQREVGEQLSSFFSRQGTSDPAVINARLETRFYAEEWNQAWAGTTEKSIRTLFEANEGLGGAAPPQVTCRSKNCQVVLSASSGAQVQALSEKFMQVATRNDAGMKDKVVTYFPEPSLGRVVFYLSENGNMDLFQ